MLSYSMALLKIILLFISVGALFPIYSSSSSSQQIEGQIVGQHKTDRQHRDELIEKLYMATSFAKFELNPTGDSMIYKDKKHSIDDLLEAKKRLDRKTEDCGERDNAELELVLERPLIFDAVNTFLTKSQDEAGEVMYKIVYSIDPILFELKEFSDMFSEIDRLLFSLDEIGKQIDEDIASDRPIDKQKQNKLDQELKSKRELENLFDLKLDQLKMKVGPFSEFEYVIHEGQDAEEELILKIKPIGGILISWLRDNIVLKDNDMPNSYLSPEVWEIIDDLMSNFYFNNDHIEGIDILQLDFPFWFEKLMQLSSNNLRRLFEISRDSHDIPFDKTSFLLSKHFIYEHSCIDIFQGICGQANFKVPDRDERLIKQICLFFAEVRDIKYFDLSSMSKLLSLESMISWIREYLSLEGVDLFNESYIQPLFAAEELIKDLAQLDKHIKRLSSNEDQNSVLTIDGLIKIRRNLIEKYQTFNEGFIEMINKESTSIILEEPYLKNGALHLLFRNLKNILADYNQE